MKTGVWGAGHGVNSTSSLCLQKVLTSYYSSVSPCFFLFKMETIKPSSEIQDLNKIMSETHSANMHGQ